MESTKLLFFVFLIKTAFGAISTSDFFPYGPPDGDFIVPIADDNYVSYNFTNGHQFHFFHNSYPDVFVNNNGGVSFVRGVPAYTPTCGPQNTPMIVPYWADVNTINGGNVYYRETSEPTLLRKAKDEVQRAFNTITNLNLRWMFIATWDNVAFFGAQNNCSGTNYRNTFQTVLVTDDTKSFVIFNYNKVDWTTGTASGGDCTGHGGQPAKSGFDVGDGVNFFSLPGTCTPDIANVVNTTNVNRSGQWIFRVDQNFEDPSNNNTTQIFNETETTEYPNPWGNCDPNDCTLEGYCFQYAACDPSTSTYRRWTCSEGLFWNPHAPTGNGTGNSSMYYSYAAYNMTNSTQPIEECHGSCDVWDNLSEQVKRQYRADQSCFPQCFYAGVGECESRYYFHGHAEDGREVETVNCPIDTRKGRNIPMVWVQERETCDFCYNAPRYNGNGTCCEKYDLQDGSMHVPLNVTGRALVHNGFDLKKKLSGNNY